MTGGMTGGPGTVDGGPGAIVEVTGGAAGVAASYAALLALAAVFDEAAGQMRGWAAEGARTLLDPELLASALLSPGTFAEAEAAVLVATTGPDGVGVESLGWEVDARALRPTQALPRPWPRWSTRWVAPSGGRSAPPLPLPSRPRRSWPGGSP